MNIIPSNRTDKSIFDRKSFREKFQTKNSKMIAHKENILSVEDEVTEEEFDEDQID